MKGGYVMFKEFREVENHIEREKHLSLQQSSDESQNYREIKAKNNLSVEEARRFLKDFLRAEKETIKKEREAE